MRDPGSGGGSRTLRPGSRGFGAPPARTDDVLEGDGNRVPGHVLCVLGLLLRTLLPAAKRAARGPGVLPRAVSPPRVCSYFLFERVGHGVVCLRF